MSSSPLAKESSKEIASLTVTKGYKGGSFLYNAQNSFLKLHARQIPRCGLAIFKNLSSCTLRSLKFAKDMLDNPRSLHLCASTGILAHLQLLQVFQSIIVAAYEVGLLWIFGA